MNRSRKQVCIRVIFSLQTISEPKLILYRSMVTHTLVRGKSLSAQPRSYQLIEKEKILKINKFLKRLHMRLRLEHGWTCGDISPESLGDSHMKDTLPVLLMMLLHAHTHTDIMMVWNHTGVTFFRILQLNRNAAGQSALQWSKDGTQWPNRFISEKRFSSIYFAIFTLWSFIIRRF